MRRRSLVGGPGLVRRSGWWRGRSLRRLGPRRRSRKRGHHEKHRHRFFHSLPCGKNPKLETGKSKLGLVTPHLSLVTCHSSLLLKQVFESLARVVGPGPGGAPRRRLPLNGGARRVKRTVVAGVFLGNPVRNRLGALELGRSIEIRALLATVQLKGATRTPPGGIEVSGEDGATASAAHDGVGPRHPRSLGTESLRLRSRSLIGALLPSLAIGILVASLSIFSLTHV